MKCAGCNKMHMGIEGLMPVQTVIPVGRPGHLAYYDMLCGDCVTLRKKKDREKEQATASYERSTQGH